ncbi:hypothetical protein JHK82_034075 [Glycine max]|nr:hypothetical protein JHK82_034075 [Glycine max]
MLCTMPLRWDFSSGYTGYVMTFEVGAVLEDANWQAPVNCFDENDKEKNIPILGSAVRGGSLGSYDVGSATWADLRKAPLQSAMEVTYICVHFVLKELVRKSISETEPSEVSIFTLKVVVAHQEICASKGFVFSQIICYMYRSSLQGIKTFIYTILGTVTIQRRVPLSLVIDIIIEQGMMASGKTTVGRILSEALSYSSFYDRLVW